jgi:hypothetical protein
MPVFRPEMQKRRAMGKIFRLVVMTAAVMAWAAPARADDDVATICRELATAAAGVNSFVMQLDNMGTTGVKGSLTFVRPMKIKSVLSIGGQSIESYLIDGVAYVRGGTGWQKTKIDPGQTPQLSVNLADSLKPANVTLMPDRQENGTSVGVFAVNTPQPAAGGPTPPAGTAPPAPAAPMHTVCTYDKASYRLKTCTNSFMKMTYTRYDDPENIVSLPPEAANRGLPHTSKAAAASPAAAASSPAASASPEVAAPSPAPPVATSAPLAPPLASPTPAH